MCAMNITIHINYNKPCRTTKTTDMCNERALQYILITTRPCRTTKTTDMCNERALQYILITTKHVEQQKQQIQVCVMNRHYNAY